MPSVTCLRLSDVSYLPCYLFSVSNSDLLFFHVGQPVDSMHSGVLGLPNIEHCRKFGSKRFLVWIVHPTGMILN